MEIKNKIVNGINVEQLFSTIEQVTANPEIARFTFKADNAWVDGTHNRATIKGFYGALQEDNTRNPIVFDLDEPPVLCGNNLGANPVEYLLAALSGCLTTSLVAHAAAKGIEVKKVESRYEGDLDLQGFLGLSEKVPVGFQAIRVFFRIEADISSDEKEALVAMAQKYSPVFNTITKSAPVTVRLEK
jgi:uncharacterized OsmC-like protein